ncbi:MAG: substrate-binding domain-containing protein, partial [Ketobacteraceae bacterium]|nr:substrate-binding domain-containing protein [Ketobacteraceae bacterium]
MQRRRVIQSMAVAGAVGLLPLATSRAFAEGARAVSVDELPPLEGKLALYLGRGEGGLYEDVLNAIQKRNPKFQLSIRRGPTAALANTIVAEAQAGVLRADVFWAVDSAAINLVTQSSTQPAQQLPADLLEQIKPGFQYQHWAPVTGRIRTVPFNTRRLTADKIPDSIMAMPDSDLSFGWAPAYSSFQSFITAMRILEGDKATTQWLKAISKKAKQYAGELGVVMAVERGEVDAGFANHYYTLRLKAGKPDANVDLAFTKNDAGCLVNTSAVTALSSNPTARNFIRYLFTE